MGDQTMGEAGAVAFSDVADKTVHWTLSLYAGAADVFAVFPGAKIVSPAAFGAFQAGYRGSRRLAEAIDPFFNDIADRERIVRRGEAILDTPGPRSQTVAFQMPDQVSWTTEGRTYRVELGPQPERQVVMRRFWLRHLNGALSWHVSFAYAYAADMPPAELYFLSLLQKALAPKEFRLRAGVTNPDITKDETGIAALDGLKVRVLGPAAPAQAEPFWRAIARLFDEDAEDLAAAAEGIWGKARHSADRWFKRLIRTDPFVEVPGLSMPRGRFMFFFQDMKLFDRLMPRQENGAPRKRYEMVQSECYAPYVARIQSLQDATPPGATVALDAEFWRWALEREDYKALGYFEPAAIEEARTTRPAFEDKRRDCYEYLWISGFLQNIIDFMNQDAHEILDSIDPIYPTSEEQEGEHFFVRFANHRALTTVVRNSRSLEAGNDYIGACPYAFLIHLTSLHNECLVRDYEERAEALLQSVENADEPRELRRAVQAFYTFRKHDLTDYQRAEYGNMFRYDTERDVFARLSDLRGVRSRTETVNALVDNVERQTRDAEERLRRNSADRMALLLGFLSILAIFYTMAEKVDELAEEGKIIWDAPLGVGLGSTGLAPNDWLMLAAIGISPLALLVLVCLLLWRWRLR